MKKNRIGVVAPKNYEGGLGIPSAYAAFLSTFGILIPINPLDDNVNTDIDILLLLGGSDVNPARYGELHNIDFMTQNPNIQLEYFDVCVLPKYIDNKIPILGICRGFQTLNVHFGGRLDQHIYQSTSASNNRAELVHHVVFTNEGFTIAKSIGVSTFKKMKINSLHHQGFFTDDAGEGIISMLTNEEQGNVEAFIHKTLPVAGVQWHPEEIYDDFSMSLIQYLLSRSERNVQE